MSSVVALVVLISVFSQVSSEEYVYVNPTFPTVPCVENPLKDTCLVDYKIPDLSAASPKRAMSIGNKTMVQNLLNSVSDSAKQYRVNLPQKCDASIKNYICRRFSPVCNDSDDYVEVDGQKTLEACKQIYDDCSLFASLLKSKFDCSLKKERYPTRMICKDFPDVKNNPYPCPKRDYKVPEFLTNESRVAELLNAHQLLKNEESKLNKTCRDKVADTMCKIAFPACTKDRKYVVNFLNKEQCDVIRQCLNVKNVNPELTNRTKEWCNSLPSESAMKIKVADAFDRAPTDSPTTPENKATSEDVASKILILAFLSFLGFLFQL